MIIFISCAYLIAFLKAVSDYVSEIRKENFGLLYTYRFLFCSFFLFGIKFRFKSIFCTWTRIVLLESIFYYYFRSEFSATIFWFSTIFTAPNKIFVDESISCWCGIDGECINSDLSIYLVIYWNPESGCDIQYSINIKSVIVMYLILVNNMLEEESNSVW